MGLFAMGLAGLVIGRRSARRRKSNASEG
jgi:hypothetical protein